ncbi:monosaccharide ABC transporter substrate-binding protein, CUT2 family (TC 3.A.1.2.-) [Gracilibacillus orientalis]|uniref:Monosaccharide ABC transporter substrate-binding protein, CUT2 family (TC 3.A.1.2.-) n=1 Tax=Gracilibacillus orientalis TaxID=334253 RepID=A0A1I4LQW8_9BACI|nr:sugar-binding protein [Gracilibacillus orientalis]SFL92987.1 monosaccharide ABC transporter substrate-binding protein, CUT2 family (TC 3.A.1.2.-) [Gracilibacillus orientalis]
MRSSKLMNIILIFCFIIAVSFSIYFYIQSKGFQSKIMDATSKETVPTYHFVLIGEEMDHDYWRLVGEGAKDMEEKYDVFVEYEGPRRSNPEEQLKLLDIAMKSKVDGIIVQALNDEFLPVINQAVEQDIPVITIDTDAPDSKRSAYIGTDNYEAGKLAGKALVEDTAGKATIGVITGSFDNAHHQLRVEGFRDIVEQEPGIEIVSIEESNITRVIAEEKAHNMLSDYPDITALYGTSALDGIGMVAAAESLGLEESLYMIGFDTLPANMALLEQEKMDVLIGQKPYEMGYRSVELMLDLVNNKKVQDVYHTNASVVRKEDIGDFDD